MGDAHFGNRLKFRTVEHMSRGIMRRVEDQGARPRRDGRLQRVNVEFPVWDGQRDKHRLCVAEDRVGAVVLVERLKNDHFVARIDKRQKHRRHRLCSAAGHRDLSVRIHRHAVAREVLPRDGVAERFGAPRGGVLVEVATDGVAGGFLHFLWHGKVRKPLGEVHGAVLISDTGHFANDRLGERQGAAGIWHARKVIPLSAFSTATVSAVKRLAPDRLAG